MPNTVFIRPDGPLIIRGDLCLRDADGKILSEENELYLCRCGHSANKPFCDGSHKKNHFSDGATFTDDRAEPLENADAPLEISLKPGAMLIIKGPVTIQSEDGKNSTTRNRAALCRCGLSRKKPFCDVSHKKLTTTQGK